MRLRNNQALWCNSLTDQSDLRGTKERVLFPGNPEAIKRRDLSPHLISDLSLGAKGPVFKGSLSLLQLVIPHSSSSFLAFSLSLLLSFKYSFIYIFFSLQVNSSWLFFPTPAASPVAISLFSFSSWASFFSFSLV